MCFSRGLSTLGLSLALFSVGACSSALSTNEQAPQASSISAEVEGVPRVSEPLDAKAIDPCAILDSPQLKRLGVSPASAEDISSGAAARCAWTASDGSYLLDVVIDVNAGLGLAYVLRESFPAFEKLAIGSHPAVKFDPEDASQCRVWVGLAESQVMTTTARNLLNSAPPLCEKAEALASEVIDALRHRS
jgi:hypothetical protein